MTACADGLHCYKLTKKLARVLGPAAAANAGNRWCLWSGPGCVTCPTSTIRSRRCRPRPSATTSGMRHSGRKPSGTPSGRASEPLTNGSRSDPLPHRRGRAVPGWYANAGNAARADALDFALHAVAACCRTCVGYWHGLPKGRPLTEDEIAYLSELARRYLDARLPDLPEEGQRARHRLGPGPQAPSNVRLVKPAPASAPPPDTPRRHAS